MPSPDCMHDPCSSPRHPTRIHCAQRDPSERARTAQAYGSTAALDSVGFDITRGEIVCLIGRNGAGKTTLLDLLAGLKPPTSGEMHLAGEIYRPADRAEARAAGVGIVTQRLSIDPRLTVAEALVRETYRASLTTERQLEFARQALADYGSDLDQLERLGDLERADITVVELLRLAYAETQLILLDEITATFNDHEIPCSTRWRTSWLPKDGPSSASPTASTRSRRWPTVCSSSGRADS